MNSVKCPIWGTRSREAISSGDFRDISSPRAGGRYVITGTAETALEGVDDRTRASLTTWIVNQHRYGEPRPRITSDIVDLALGMPSLPLSQRLQRLFEFFAMKIDRVGTILRIDPSGSDAIIREDSYEMMAWLECHDAISMEMISICTLLQDQGFVKSNTLRDGWAVELTPAGYARLEETQSRTRLSVRAFVAMWFDHSMDDAYSKGIEPAIVSNGYEPLRLDYTHHVGKIDDEIIASIKASRFVVADFTCDIVRSPSNVLAISRGNVYYEAGFAHGLGIDVIFCCRHDRLNFVQFDLRQYPYIDWKDTTDLEHRLTARIAATIGRHEPV